MIHCHAANVVHGDLKPANVLLARSRADRRGFTAKVRGNVGTWVHRRMPSSACHVSTPSTARGLIACALSPTMHVGRARNSYRLQEYKLSSRVG